MKSKEEVNLMSPLTWSYIGDCVYELFIRTHLVETTNLKPHKLHIEAVKQVKAKAQANKLEELQEMLTEEEKEIVRRTRNTKNHHVAKNANPRDYMYATAFEGLIGYLYLSEQKERLEQILNKCI
jgi:ribonuclease III family protein